NRAEHDLQLQTFDGRIHLLTDADYEQITREKRSYMPPLKASAVESRNLVAYLSTLAGISPGPINRETEPIANGSFQVIATPKRGEWPTYNGVLGGNRYSPLDQINTKRRQTPTRVGAFAQQRRIADDTSGGGRRHVRDGAWSSLRARCADRP